MGGGCWRGAGEGGEGGEGEGDEREGGKRRRSKGGGEGGKMGILQGGNNQTIFNGLKSFILHTTS